MLFLNEVYYTVDGQNKSNKWTVIKNYELLIAPIVMRLTQEIYNFMLEFFFSRDSVKKENVLVDNRLQRSLEQTVSAIKGRCYRAPSSSTK
jgi:hypothetical protein